MSGSLHLRMDWEFWVAGTVWVKCACVTVPTRGRQGFVQRTQASLPRELTSYQELAISNRFYSSIYFYPSQKNLKKSLEIVINIKRNVCVSFRDSFLVFPSQILYVGFGFCLHYENNIWHEYAWIFGPVCSSCCEGLALLLLLYFGFVLGKLLLYFAISLTWDLLQVGCEDSLSSSTQSSLLLTCDMVPARTYSSGALKLLTLMPTWQTLLNTSCVHGTWPLLEWIVRQPEEASHQEQQSLNEIRAFPEKPGPLEEWESWLFLDLRTGVACLIKLELDLEE